MRRIFGLVFFISLISLLGCESPPADRPTPAQLEIELLGCIDEPHPKDTCADFCEWDGALCIENACEGITARSFPFANYCFDDEPEVFINTTLGCEDALVFDATHAYYDCCCDYR